MTKTPFLFFTEIQQITDSSLIFDELKTQVLFFPTLKSIKTIICFFMEKDD